MTPSDTDGLAERNPWEVANQLVGYIDTSTPTDLAGFLLRESSEAAKLARTIEAQAARIAELEGALERAIPFLERHGAIGPLIVARKALGRVG